MTVEGRYGKSTKSQVLGRPSCSVSYVVHVRGHLTTQVQPEFKMGEQYLLRDLCNMGV
jgi:hypothetical protein